MSSTNAERVLASVQMWGDAGTFPKIASTLKGTVPPRTLKRWLSQLVREGRLIRRGASIGTRYALSYPPRGNGGGPVAMGDAAASSFGAGSPYSADSDRRNADRLDGNRRVPPNGSSVSYDRAVLDAYWPNETVYLTDPMRTHLSRRLAVEPAMAGRDLRPPPPGPGVLAASSPALPLSPGWQQFTADLVVWSRDAQIALGFVPRRHRRVLAPSIVAAVVARADVPTMAGELRRIWNHRAAVALLASPEPPTLTLETMAAIQAALIGPPARAAGAAPASLAPAPVATLAPRRRPLCRTEPLLLAGTAYHPTADVDLIEPCLRQLVLTAGAILDPAEASFFVFAHLLLLLPFAIENLSAAVLLANLPLLRAGLAPVSPASIPPAEFRAAVLAWWELRRPDPLAQMWTRAARSAAA